MKNCLNCKHASIYKSKFRYCKNKDIKDLVDDIIDKFDLDDTEEYYEQGFIAMDCQFYNPVVPEQRDLKKLRHEIKQTLTGALLKHL